MASAGRSRSSPFAPARHIFPGRAVCVQRVEPPQRYRAVDVEEVDRKHAGGLSAQELPPRGVGVPHRRRWDAVALQDPPDRRGTDPVAEFEQLALDPLVPPVRAKSLCFETASKIDK